MLDYISIILNLLLGSGLLGAVMFYRIKRRKESAEATEVEMGNRLSEFEIHRKSIEFLSQQLGEAYTEIDKLQDIVNSKRDDVISLIRQTKQLEIDIIAQQSLRRRAEMLVCYDSECQLRREVKPS